MSSDLSNSALSNSVDRLRSEKWKDPLAVCAEELARLRFSINLAAQFAYSSSQHPLRKQELRARLALLRRQYIEKIDEMILILKADRALDESTIADPHGVSRAASGQLLPCFDSIDPGI
jgi:hypothetical protein